METKTNTQGKKKNGLRPQLNRKKYVMQLVLKDRIVGKRRVVD